MRFNSRKKGWRMAAKTVKIDSHLRWAMFSSSDRDGTREECIAHYRRFVAGRGATTRGMYSLHAHTSPSTSAI